MAISRAKEQFERDKASKFQRMLELEKQRALERLNADPTSSSPHTNQSPYTLATHTTSPASPVSLSSGSNPPPSYLRSHPTVSRRPLPVDSPLATPKNDFHPGKARQGGSQEVEAAEAAEAAEAVAANNSTCDAASTTTALSHQTRYAHQLPPIRTDIGAASLAAEITEAFPTYQEDGSMDAAGRRRQSRPSSRLVPPQPSPQPSPEPSPAGQPDSGVELDSSVGPSPVGGDEARGRRRRLTKPLPTAVAQNRSTQSADRSEPAPASPTTKPGKYYPPQSYTGSKKAHAESESRTRQHQQHPPSAGGKAGGTAPGESVDAAAADSSRRGRSRSRSISSLFRRSLDGRRSSFGLGSSSQDTGFIGGIKLEKERLEAHERSLSERPIGPEADIHPALRTNDNQKTRRRSPSPFKFSTTQRNSEPRDSHYPPIAIRNQSQSQVFVNAERPRSSSGSSISRWKARVGLSPSPSMDTVYAPKPTPKLTKPPSIPREDRPKKSHIPTRAPPSTATSTSALPTGTPPSSSASNTRGATWKHLSAPVISSSLAPTRIGPPASVSRNGPYPMKPALVNRSRAGSPLVDRPGTSMCTERSPMPASAFVVDRPRCESLNTDLDITDTAEAGGDDMAGSDKSGSEISYMTAPSTPPPPPRRSSKRRSAAYVYEGAREQSKNQARANGKEQDHPGHAAKDTLPASPTVMLLHHHSKPTTAADRRDSPQSASTARKRGPNDPPSIPYDSLPAESPIKAHSRRSLVGAAKAAFRLSMPDLSTITARSRTPSRDARRSCSPAPSPDILSVPGGSGKPAKLLGLNNWDLAPPPPLLISPARSSSEDTCSDDLRSTTLSRPSSTPNTSRPQSIGGSPGLLGAEDKWQQHHSGYTSALPSPAFSCADGSLRLSAPPPMDLDPIQAAALKIMAQFPDVPYSVHSNRSEPSLRTHRSKSSLAAENLQQRTAPLQKPGLEVPKPLRLPVRPTSAAASTPSVGDMVKASRGKDDDYDDGQETLSKVFVECCSCKHYHDMPDELYDAMINSRGGAVSTEFSAAARCNWCRHVMKTRCCARLSTLVQVKERVH